MPSGLRLSESVVEHCPPGDVVVAVAVVVIQHVDFLEVGSGIDHYAALEHLGSTASAKAGWYGWRRGLAYGGGHRPRHGGYGCHGAPLRRGGPTKPLAHPRARAFAPHLAKAAYRGIQAGGRRYVRFGITVYVPVLEALYGLVVEQHVDD